MNARPYSTTDRSGTAARLDVERTLALDRLANLHLDFAAMVAASADSNADDEHDPEGATIAFERSQLDALILQAQRHLADIGLARDRLAQGAYEKCESCGNPIGQARLEARPVARDCITCATLKISAVVSLADRKGTGATTEVRLTHDASMGGSMGTGAIG